MKLSETYEKPGKYRVILKITSNKLNLQKDLFPKRGARSYEFNFLQSKLKDDVGNSLVNRVDAQDRRHYRTKLKPNRSPAPLHSEHKPHIDHCS
ncbi:hypothetical protein Y032_0048g1710 [Ancylostoma ceylanicum]|uniref:Uncharacterized protein n=1 Tax=Ancylostoma ceylanicum TaxID=53326 RepID=A0A016UBG2_9BILA|nr:hypothetical protein Y032_0048g1710 [Ancylostoma ceylanicum]